MLILILDTLLQYDVEFERMPLIKPTVRITIFMHTIIIPYTNEVMTSDFVPDAGIEVLW